jgi:hypothetical protein
VKKRHCSDQLDLHTHTLSGILEFEPFPREELTPETLAAVQKADIEKWWPIIKAASIKAE